MIRRCTIAVLAVAAASLSASAQSVPTPESVLGQSVGADFFLATFEESMEYFRRLDAASDRVMMRDVGESSFGRTTPIVFISSAENLADLDRYVEIAQRLAHPDGLSEDEAREVEDYLAGSAEAHQMVESLRLLKARTAELPESIERHARDADRARREGNSQEALAAWQLAAKMAPGNPKVQTELAIAHLLSGDGPGARRAEW